MVGDFFRGFLGYYPEVRDLLRSCHERISRCYLFFFDGETARRFLEGKQIWQNEVNQKLSKLGEDLDKREKLRKGLQEYYDFMSDTAHPNLKSFEARYGKKDLGTKVGLQCVFGGLMSTKRGHVTIIRILQTVLSALRILGIMLPEQSGSWDRKYQQISKKCDQIVENL